MADSFDPALFTAIAVALAYAMGSVPWGLILARGQGLDIRNVGSGNIGATNVARNLGKRVGAVVLLLDAIKGAVPVAVAVGFDLSARWHQPYLLTWVGLAAIVGHCFPVWLKFRGGKGVATSLGVFLVVDPLLALIGVALFGLVYAAFKVASLGSITGALSFPVLAWALGRPQPMLLLCVLGAALVIVKHQANIRRLLTRSELKV